MVEEQQAGATQRGASALTGLGFYLCPREGGWVIDARTSWDYSMPL